MLDQRNKLLVFSLAALCAGVLVLAGCGQDTVNSPELTTEPDFVPLVVAGATLEMRGSVGWMSAGSEPAWFIVGEGLAMKNRDRKTTSDKCDLTFYAGAVDATTQVKIYMYDVNVLEFEFTPDGVPFGVPVRVDVRYAGTNADPDSPNYDGSIPAFFWHNPATGLWEEVPGTNDTTDKTYVAYVEHFSRYTLGTIPPGDGGTADW
jgi:hypothetical protein